MTVKTTLAAAAVGAVLAIPITAGAVGAAGSPEVDTPCGVDATWTQQHWNDPSHWDEMTSHMEQHWAEMDSFMEEHWGEMGSHMFSDGFDRGPGMMGGFGRLDSADVGPGMWQDGES